MARKRDTKAKGEEQGKSKELKIITVQVVTPDKVVSNPRMMGVLYVISKLGVLHEKTLFHVVKKLQDAGATFGYNFNTVAGTPYSPELKTDLVSLMYVGFVETEPGLYRKLRVTSAGREALEKHGAPQGIVSVLDTNFKEIRNEASLMDGQIDLAIRRSRQPERRQRRFIPPF